MIGTQTNSRNMSDMNFQGTEEGNDIYVKRKIVTQ